MSLSDIIVTIILLGHYSMLHSYCPFEFKPVKREKEKIFFYWIKLNFKIYFLYSFSLYFFFLFSTQNKNQRPQQKRHKKRTISTLLHYTDNNNHPFPDQKTDQLASNSCRTCLFPSRQNVL